MSLTVTPMKEDNKCIFYIDDFIDDKFALTATGLKFVRRALFTQDPGEPVFDLPLEDAKEMAREILKLGDECPECGNPVDECICAAIIDEYLDENN